MARHNDQALPLPHGVRAYGERFSIAIWPYPPGNQALTWEMAERVLFSLSQFMASGGGYRLLQYHAFTEGLTPADDVQFGSGEIAMTTSVGPVRFPAVVAPQARGFPVELMGGDRG